MKRSIPWETLLSLLDQIHGWEINSSAVRVALFSLYVGLLEEVSPRDIRKLISRGKILPELWNKTLVNRDFFTVAPETAKYQVIIGKPPWISRQGSDRSSIKGIIDITVHFNLEREEYLAYECKRLNVMYADRRRSLATPYVTQGMMRFVTEQYAAQLPVGCMLGYVLDGDITFALNKLTHAITTHAPLGLTDGPANLAAVLTVQRFRTRHVREDSPEIELRHALIAFI